MRFIAIILALFLGVALAAEVELSQDAVADPFVGARGAAVQEATVAEVEKRSTDETSAVSLLSTRDPLQKRKCDYNGCKCASRGYQFRSCGNCRWTNNNEWAISKKRVSTHIFECGPTGNCCDYGPASDCGTANARCFIRD